MRTLAAPYTRRCTVCGCNVSTSHIPGSDDCAAAREERLWSIGHDDD